MRELWLTVLDTALSDIQRSGRLRDDVIEWLDTEDFELICELASLKSEIVLARFKEMI